VVYSLGGLTSLRYGRLFAINSSTGDVSVCGLIDYEQSSVYHLSVVAADRAASTPGGASSLSATASVTVATTSNHSLIASYRPIYISVFAADNNQ